VPDGLADEKDGGSSCRASMRFSSSRTAVGAALLASGLPFPIVDADDDDDDDDDDNDGVRGEDVEDEVGVASVAEKVAGVEVEGGISAGHKLHSRCSASQ